MADEIAPALTPEEWNPACHWSATAFIVGRYSPDRGMGPRENVGGFEIRVNAEGARAKTGPRAIAEFSDHDAHAIAALALYGQPFGFTRADVELELQTAEHYRVQTRIAQAGENPLYDEGIADKPAVIAKFCAERAQHHESVAARIAALLPPEALNG